MPNGLKLLSIYSVERIGQQHYTHLISSPVLETLLLLLLICKGDSLTHGQSEIENSFQLVCFCGGKYIYMVLSRRFFATSSVVAPGVLK